MIRQETPHPQFRQETHGPGFFRVPQAIFGPLPLGGPLGSEAAETPCSMKILFADYHGLPGYLHGYLHGLNKFMW